MKTEFGLILGNGRLFWLRWKYCFDRKFYSIFWILERNGALKGIGYLSLFRFSGKKQLRKHQTRREVM